VGGKVNFGVKKLDDLIGNDLGAGSNVLIIGPSGSGKTILGLNFLFTGIKNGEKVLYLTLLEPVEEIEKYAKKLGFPLEEAKKKKSWYALYYSPRDLIEILKSGSGTLSTYIKERKITRVFIDGFSALIYLIHTKEDMVALDSLKSLFYKKPEGVTLLIALNNDDLFEIKTLILMADVVIKLDKIVEKGEVRHIIYIDKMRISDFKDLVYEYNISEGHFKIGKIYE
jgi:circadian clock protein KaiC